MATSLPCGFSSNQTKKDILRFTRMRLATANNIQVCSSIPKILMVGLRGVSHSDLRSQLGLQGLAAFPILTRDSVLRLQLTVMPSQSSA